MRTVDLISELRAKKIRLGLAESCTGGLLGAAITSVPGSSHVFMLGHITYSNEAKQKFLGVDEKTLAEHGAVSEQVAQQMAEGLLHNNPELNLAVAITGIAGPGGESKEKPIGLVYIALADHQSATRIDQNLFHGNREAIRHAAVERALTLIGEVING